MCFFHEKWKLARYLYKWYMPWSYLTEFLLGYAFKDLKGVNLYPSVGMKRPLAHLSVNFGQKPFTFDIDGMMAVCKFMKIPISTANIWKERESRHWQGDQLCRCFENLPTPRRELSTKRTCSSILSA